MNMEERISTFHEYHEIVSAYAPLGQGTRYFLEVCLMQILNLYLH